MSIGKTIARYRKLRDLTQTELAAKINVHQTQIAHWETERAKPRKEYLQKLSEALEINVDDLASGVAPSMDLDEIEDPELKALLLQVTRLSPRQHQALKIVLEDMVKISRFQDVAQGKT
jgi:transcriptional regulator with XRE-family HTH domain